MIGRAIFAGLPLVLVAGQTLAHDHGEAHTHPAAQPAAADPSEPADTPSVAAQPPSAAASRVPPLAAQPATPQTYPPPLSEEEAPGVYRSRTIDDNTWRQQARRGEPSSNKLTDWGHFYFELRFGPYSPEVDEEFEGRGQCNADGSVPVDESGNIVTGGTRDCTPYEDFFGTDALFYFGIELDWLPLYIPYVVSIGPGFGWGVTSASGNAVTESGDEAASETSLTIFPMHLSAVARFDGPLRELDFPVVPYVKAGLGLGLWSASGPTTDDEGTSYGMHLAIGGAVALNAFDQSAAMSMQENTGIRYANLWAEWMMMNLDGIGSVPQMHVGTSTVVLGLALDF